MIEVLYTVENLAELFDLDALEIKRWVKDELLIPSHRRPLRFSKKYIDDFVNSGKLEQCRPVPAGTRRGIWHEL